MNQGADIIQTFQMHGNQMTLAQIAAYSFFFEFRSRKTEINKEHPEFMIRFIRKKYESPSDHLYVLEKKPKPGDLI